MKRIAQTKKNVKKLFEAMQGEEWMNQELKEVTGVPILVE